MRHRTPVHLLAVGLILAGIVVGVGFAATYATTAPAEGAALCARCAAGTGPLCPMCAAKAGTTCRNCAAGAAKLAEALKAIDAAHQAVQAGDKDAAVAALGEAKALVTAARKALIPPPAGVVNAVCPIMGNKIDPAKVPDSLIREYKGQKVGFCCAGCPVAWDKLSDAEKDAKLQAALQK